MKWKLTNLQWKKPAWKKPDWSQWKQKLPKWKRPKASKKALILTGAALALVAAILLGIVFFGTSREPVAVYPFTMVGMDGYWGDTQESYGPVSTDKIQTVYLSDTQTVTEVLVAQGDSVKKGDVLMSFDTSLSDLQLERKRLEVEKLKLELDTAKAELKTIQALKPMQPMPDFQLPDLPVYLGATLVGEYKTYIVSGYDGKSEETAFVCWVKDGKTIDDALLEALRLEVWKETGLCAAHGKPLAQCPICNCTHGPGCEVCTLPRCTNHNELLELCPVCKTCIHGDTVSQCALCTTLCQPHGVPTAFCSQCSPICVHGAATSTCPLCSKLCEHKVPVDYCKYCCTHGKALGSCTICYCEHGVLRTEACSQCSASQARAGNISASGSYRIQFLANSTPSGSDNFYVIFKSTSGNTELGPQTTWQGVHVQGRGKDFTLRYFTPATGDYTVPEIEEPTIIMPDYDPGSGMTATQIAQLRAEQEQKIKELTLKHKMADAEYKIMAKEMGDGHIYAEFDGSIVSLLPEQEAKDTKQPVVKVSGGGGFFIAGSVSELEKENLKVGQEVTVNDWSSGGMYTGTVKEIGDFPSIDGYWNGNGNPNTTYYPFTVFVGDEASLQAGAYANIQYSTGEASTGIYLEKAFLRSEDGHSYVWLRGADGKLEKRFVTTGKNLWGSYMEIKSGLTVEDYIAFPYGKDVRSGAPTQEGDLAQLYGY